MKLLQDAATKVGYVSTIELGYQRRRTEGSVEDRWKELKQCILESGEKHIEWRKKKQKKWISDDTMQIIDAKREVYRQWQECRTDAGRQSEYRTLRKAVRKAVKDDRVKWLHTAMHEMEDSLKRNRQGDFFRKLRDITVDRVKPTGTILDECGQPIKNNEEKLARWKRHFGGVLNVRSVVNEEVIASIEDQSTSDTADVTREEVEEAVGKLKNGKTAGGDEVVAELVKNGGQAMIDWLWELFMLYSCDFAQRPTMDKEFRGALHDLVPPTVWNASFNKWWRLKQSIQLVHVPLSSWHNAALGTQLGKV